MKKLLFLLVLISPIIYAKDVIVVYKPDKTVAVIHPIANKPLPQIYSDAVKDTDLAGLPYEVVDDSTLPDREYRDAWEHLPNKEVKVNQGKVQRIQQKRIIMQRQKEKLRRDTIQELMNEGTLPNDYVD